MAKPIEMLFGALGRMGPSSHAFDRRAYPPRGRDNFGAKSGGPL